MKFAKFKRYINKDGYTVTLFGELVISYIEEADYVRIETANKWYRLDRDNVPNVIVNKITRVL